MLLPRATWILLAVPLACSSGSGLQGLAPDEPEPISGSISGQIRSTDGQPLAEASIRIQPGNAVVVSDPVGRFVFQNLAVEQRGRAYILTITADGFRTLIRTIVLTTEEPGADFGIALVELEADSLPRAQNFEIRGYYDAEQWPPVDGVEAIVEIQVRGPEQVSGVVLVDTLDAAFGYRIAPEDISVNDSLVPPAGLTIAPDGLSLRIELGDLQPTEGFVRVFTLRIPPPQGNGVWCNYAHVSGLEDSEPAGDVDIFCIATTLGG